jgi:hypothetical protein
MITVMEQSNNIAKCGVDSFGISKCNLVDHNMRKYCIKCGFVVKVYEPAPVSFSLIASNDSLLRFLPKNNDAVRPPLVWGIEGGFSF